MSSISNEYLYSLLQDGYIFTDLSNPHVQPRVLRILAACRQVIREFLGKSALDELVAGFDDLIFILNRGRSVVAGDGVVAQVNGDNIYAEHCDFIVLRSVFELRTDVIADMKVRSTYNVNQFYILLALFEFGKSFKLFVECKEKLLAEPVTLAEVTSMALNFLVAAQDIIAFVYPKLISEIKGGEVESLKAKLARKVKIRKDIGKKSHYDKFYEAEFPEVFARWEMEVANDEGVTALSEVVKKLKDKAKALRLPITGATIKANLKKRGKIPSQAIKIGAPKSGSRIKTIR